MHTPWLEQLEGQIGVPQFSPLQPLQQRQSPIGEQVPWLEQPDGHEGQPDVRLLKRVAGAARRVAAFAAVAASSASAITGARRSGRPRCSVGSNRDMEPYPELARSLPWIAGWAIVVATPRE
jgi:hypothetical protein